MNIQLFITFLAMAFTSTTSWSWKQLPQKGPKVSGHSSATTIGENILLFGGLTGAAGSPVTDELWRFKEGSWSQESSEQGPGRRMYSASAILKGSLYLFGGWDPGAKGSGGTFLDDVWKLDLDTMKWEQRDPMPCGPVSRHTACTVGKSIIIHTFRGVMEYCDGKLMEKKTAGDEPQGLSMCATAPLGDKAMLLFGGSTKTQSLSDAVYILDTRGWVWTKLVATNDGPLPLASACGAPLDESRCIIFGGAAISPDGYQSGAGLVAQDDTWLLTVKKDSVEWSALAKGPEARIAATLSPVAPGSFVLQGGYDPSTKYTFDELWLLTSDE